MGEIFGVYKFRYYFNEDLLRGMFSREQARIRDVTIKLLEEIKRKLGIDYELYPFRSGEEVLVYKEHFVSRSRLLNKVHDQTVAQALKSRRGHIYLNNVIAIVRNGSVVWYHKGWNRDLELWLRKAEEVKIEYGLDFAWPHLGFLKIVLENPGYLNQIINVIEQNIDEDKLRISSHDSLVFKAVEILIKNNPRVAVLVEVPLGLKLLHRALVQRKDVPLRYRLSLRSLELAAYPLRADIVAVYDPVGLEPGVYPCARGFQQVFRLQDLYSARFPARQVRVLDVNELVTLKLGGSKAEIIEVKTGRVGEQAIGQLLTYEALLRMDVETRSIEKTIAAPREQIESINPLLRLIIDGLGIKLMPL